MESNNNGTPGIAPNPNQQARAIEFAEYMAKAAENLMDAFNAEAVAQEAYDSASATRCGAAYISPDEDAVAEAERTLEAATQDRAEAWTTLQSAIYEFRKRKPRPSTAGLTDIVRTGDPEDPTPRQHISAWLQDQLDLLPDFGWMDGGCFTLAKALQKLGEKHGTAVQMYAFNRENGSPDHFLVGPADGYPGLYLDGDGFADGAEVVRKMREEEGVDGYLSVLRDEETAQVHALQSFWYDKSVADELAARLDKAFGVAMLDHLTA